MSSHLEVELGRLLAPVRLVCDAPISDELLDEAEAQVRAVCNDSRIESFARRQPATLVSYFVLRGSQRYRRNSVWPELGVTEYSGRVGAAFLGALRQLGLPTFEREAAIANARRYVAPLLIHGAIPSKTAGRLVRRLELALRRGVVNAAEARRRLVADPDLVVELGRPASRLMSWAPDYAEFLIDTIFDHIEDPAGGAIAALPIHLQTALTEQSESHQGLRRIRPPSVRFEIWSGFGPELNFDGADDNWSIRLGSHAAPAHGHGPIELTPNDRATASNLRRSIELWRPAEAWFFHLDGKFIEHDKPLPARCVALLPMSAKVTTAPGLEARIIEEGVPLGGAWSRFYSIHVDLAGEDQVFVTDSASDGQSLRVVSQEAPIRLIGDVVDRTTGPDLTPVFSEIPQLFTPDHPASFIRLRYEPAHGSPIIVEAVSDEEGLAPLDEVIPDGASQGTLDVRFDSNEHHRLPITVIPELMAHVPSDVIGPDETPNIEVLARTGVLAVSGRISAPQMVAAVPLEVLGLPPGSVNVQLPRVRWAIRSTEHRRIELEPGLVQADVDSLIVERIELLVRCGVPADVSAVLIVNGEIAQRSPARATISVGLWQHHRAIDLSIFRDTLRARADASIQIDIEIGGKRLPAVQCGPPFVAVEQPAVVSRIFPTPPPAVELELQRRRDEVAAEHDLRSDDLELQLRVAGVGGIADLLRLLGEVSRTQAPGIRQTDTNSDQWDRLNEVARKLWGLNGIRNRLFAGTELTEGLSVWAGGWRSRLRREPQDLQNEIQMWMTGRRPAFQRLSEWGHSNWINTCLPRESDSFVQKLPATVLFHCLALTAGDDDSDVVNDAAGFNEQLLFEAVAFVMEVVRRRIPVDVPTLSEAEPPPEAVSAAEGEGEQSVLETRPHLVDFRSCMVDIAGRTIQILPDQPAIAPAIRLFDEGRAVAALQTFTQDDLFTVDVPGDIGGDISIGIIASDLVVGPDSSHERLHVPQLEWAPSSTRRPYYSLSDIQAALSDDLVDQISAAVEAGRPTEAPVEELFSDEQSAGEALIRFAERTNDGALVDRVAVAIAPAAFLFSSFDVSKPALDSIRPGAPLLYAALAPRTPAAWAIFGWAPNAKFERFASSVATFVRWVRARTQAQSCTAPSWRYDENATTGPKLTAYVCERLEENGVDSRIVDIMVATECMLSNELVAAEALRMILSAHDAQPKATQTATLAGFALHLISRN